MAPSANVFLDVPRQKLVTDLDRVNQDPLVAWTKLIETWTDQIFVD